MRARGAGRVHYAWVVLGGTAVALLAASGVRSAFGVFIQPMEAEFGWDRTTLSLVASLRLAIRERPVARRPPATVVVAPAPGV